MVTLKTNYNGLSIFALQNDKTKYNMCSNKISQCFYLDCECLAYLLASLY